MTAARLCSAALSVILLSASAALAQEAGVRWQTDFDQARQAAKESGKLMLVHFWTETCGPCKRLDATVFNQPSVAQVVDKHFVPVKLNANKSATLARALRISQVPTDVVMTADGKVLEKLISPGTPVEYVAKMSSIAGLVAGGADSAFKLAAADSRQGSVVNSAYADFLGSPKVAEQPAVAAGSGAKATNAVPVSDGITSPKVQANPYATPAPSQPATKPTADNGQSVAASKAQKTQLPPGAPPLGFDGYCTVTMKQKNSWQKGDPQFGIIHRGRTYLFAGAAERDAFFKSPDSFAPALSGADPVVALEQGRSVPGSRQFAVEYDGLFYLFSSEQTLNTFWQNSERYAAGVRQALTGGNTPLRR